ncbi:alpha/beta hydrolase-fold protein [Spirosoma sp. SC4-14]|uniref:alpha/beta hydrolase-fold protein n=1 Tax=Spirosoma sp. SC4-14 TaxID=3128900 RepID=UPI0030CDB98C
MFTYRTLFNGLIFWLLLSSSATTLLAQTAASARFRFEVSFPAAVSSSPLTGRMFLIIARKDSLEPRLQVGRYGTQFFGVDFEKLAPAKSVTIDGATLGYPINDLKELPVGDYYIQAVLSKYTEFKRSDGHTVWMHMDQWEGQDWRRSPGNVYSAVQKIRIDPAKQQTVNVQVTTIIPPISVPPDTKWVKHIKIRSEKLTKFWGQPIYIGATILLPKGYDDEPNRLYPTVYQQGHFSLAAPFRFEENEANEFYREWVSDSSPRFIAVTLQHPSPYFDDSYAVNSVNNGPYGDAIHEELIPEIEKNFRCIREGYARLLTGGSTGGWESFALQVWYPDFYGGTWSFAPDPLDFWNVEGIDIYRDKNAFYKEHEWYRVPTPNTRVPATGETRLTSQQRNTMELVNGTKGRSGGQLDVWSSVFGPVGDDGYFKPLFDKKTGIIDPTVAQYWKEHYDLRYYLEKNWSTVGPKLVGKLHVICGRMDDFFLNFGVYKVDDFLTKAQNPAYGGSFTYGERGGHSWRPYSNAELLRMMDAHLKKRMPTKTTPN